MPLLSRCPWLLLPMCLILTGCVTKSTADGATTVHYERWLPILVAVACLLTVPIGFVVANRSGGYGWTIAVLGLIVAALFVPALYLEEVTVTDRGVDVRSGIFGQTAALAVNFDDVASLRIEQEETGGRRSRVIDVIVFNTRSGTARLSLNNDVKIGARPEIVERALRRGIPLGR